VAWGKVAVLPDKFAPPFAPGVLRIGSVDAVALEARAAELAKRSIEGQAKLWALEFAVRVCDLTTLEGGETPGKAQALCSKAVRPEPADASVPSVAAVCVYPTLVPLCRKWLEGSGVKVASVAGMFPSGSSPTDLKAAEAHRAVELGAHEVDMVIDRGAFLSGRYTKVFNEIVQVKEAVGNAHLKVILETGGLGTFDNVRRASLIVMAAGADFIETSTGEVSPAAALPTALCMLEAIRDVHDETGHVVGFKLAAGVCSAKQVIQHLVLVHETLGPEWLTPDRYRIGASSLLMNDVLMEIREQKTGVFQGKDYFTVA
jgi:deoxyribose-phosphate aldolase